LDKKPIGLDFEAFRSNKKPLPLARAAFHSTVTAFRSTVTAFCSTVTAFPSTVTAVLSDFFQQGLSKNVFSIVKTPLCPVANQQPCGHLAWALFEDEQIWCKNLKPRG
jgi:hypothetical protein